MFGNLYWLINLDISQKFIEIILGRQFHLLSDTHGDNLISVYNLKEYDCVIRKFVLADIFFKKCVLKIKEKKLGIDKTLLFVKMIVKPVKFFLR